MNAELGQENDIRFDGFYQSPTENNIRKFFRFYPDGSVIEATTEAEANDIAPWFKKENFIHDYHSIGKYEIHEDKIHFSTTASGYGTIVYEGTLNPAAKMHLKSKSLINGKESEYTIYFIEIANG